MNIAETQRLRAEHEQRCLSEEQAGIAVFHICNIPQNGCAMDEASSSCFGCHWYDCVTNNKEDNHV